MARHVSPPVERLWTAADGTTCLLSTCDTAPMYALTLVRQDKVVRERRLYGVASARMMAQSWGDENSVEIARPGLGMVA